MFIWVSILKSDLVYCLGMKKAIWGGIVVVTLVLLGGYALWSASRSEQPAPATGNQIGQTSTSIQPAASAGEDNGIGDSSSPGDEDTSGQYKDGSYTGNVGSAAPYGQVQVKVTISGGAITDIKLLKAPQGPGNTDFLTSTTFPVMIQEAIAKQSSDVNIVSGATQNTEGFNASLTSALQQAS